MKRIFIVLFILLPNLLAAQKFLHPYNLDFEEGEAGKMPPGWTCPGYAVKLGYYGYLTDEKPLLGKYCLKIQNDSVYKEQMYGSLMQSIDAANYRGKLVRFRAALRAEISSKKGSAHLWIRCRLPNNEDGSYDLMEDNPVFFNDWQYYEITLRIDPNATTLNYGILLRGTGKAWLDDASFEIIDVDTSGNLPPAPLSEQAIENLFAFTKLFGYTRYYNASLESQKNNWEKFALSGVEHIEKAKNNKELHSGLENLFLPVAPSIKILNEESNPNDIRTIIPDEALRDVALLWRHSIVKTSKIPITFMSRAINFYSPHRQSEGMFSQVIDAKDLKGKEVELSFYAKYQATSQFGNGQAVLIAESKPGATPAMSSMREEPVTENQWKNYKLKMTVPENTEKLRLGLFLLGEGDVWFDNVSLSVINGEAAPIKVEIRNQGFEEEKGKDLLFGWKISKESYKEAYAFMINRSEAYSEKQCIQISSDKSTEIDFPQPGESVNVPLGSGLTLHLPLAVYVDSITTLPKPPFYLKKLESSKPKDFTLNSNDRTSRLAIVCIVWNYLKHFNLTNHNDEDWDSILKTTFSQAAKDKNEDEFIQTLRKMIAVTRDNQSRIWSVSTSSSKQENRFGFPFIWKMINNKLYVVKLADKVKEMSAGAEIVKINGEEVESVIKKNEEYIAGSTPQWKSIRTLAEMKIGQPDEKYKLTIKDKDGKTKEIEMKKDFPLNELQESKLNSFTVIDSTNGKYSYYIDLTRINDDIIKGNLSTLKKANKIIFDLRGISEANEHLLGLSSDKPIDNISWKAPVFIHPDKEKIHYSPIMDVITPKKILHPDKVIFLCDERSIGLSEIILYLAKRENIGTIIGKPTAGSPNEVFGVNFPANLYLSVTSILFNIPTELIANGIIPDITVEETIDDAVNGKDVILEKAKELLK